MINTNLPKNTTVQDLEKRIEGIDSWIQKKSSDPLIVDHFHDGYDTSQIEYTKIKNKVLYINHTVYGTDAATATSYGVFFIVPAPCVIISFQEVHQTAGTDGSAVGLNLEKLTGTEALGSGDEVLSANLSLKATINTVQTGVLSTTLSSRSFTTGDRLALKDSGTLTSIAGVTVKVEISIL